MRKFPFFWPTSAGMSISWWHHRVFCGAAVSGAASLKTSTWSQFECEKIGKPWWVRVQGSWDMLFECPEDPEAEYLRESFSSLAWTSWTCSSVYWTAVRRLVILACSNHHQQPPPRIQRFHGVTTPLCPISLPHAGLPDVFLGWAKPKGRGQSQVY